MTAQFDTIPTVHQTQFVRSHMPAFRKFELEAIHLMAEGALSLGQLRILREAVKASSYNYTGSGYFLTVTHPLLPEERRTLSDPPVVGNADNVQAGFVVFVGGHELTLECHTWGAVDVPEDFRDREVVISTPPVNFVDLRDAT